MTPRERVRMAINHQQPDKVPMDMGGTACSSISVSAYAELRQRVASVEGLAKVADPFQMTAMVEDEVREALGIDTIPLRLPTTLFGFKNRGWKPWRFPDGTEALVTEEFQPTQDEHGNYYLHPQGDTSVPPSGKMPKDGFYFDVLVRQGEIDEDNLNPEEWVDDMYHPLTDEELLYLEKRADELYNNTPFSIVGDFLKAGFGDFAFVPGPYVKEPRGIRDPVEWYAAHITHPEYIKGIYDLQTEIALQDLKKAKEAIGDKIDVIVVSGTDFGTQTAPFISPDMYREIYKPFHKRVNDWIHKNTSWKTFYHSCGSIVAFLDDFIDAGVDIINPVQCSAAGMDPATLKEKYGKDLVFWGGGIDTQKTLPFGTPEEVENEVSERLRIFGEGGGFVFAAVHNIQAKTNVENLEAMFRSFNTLRSY